MKQQEDITIQSLTRNEDIQVGYSDNDIVVVDSIQKFAEIKAAHVAMNAIGICTQGKVQAQMNGKPVELHKNQAFVVPLNVTITDVMVSPDFNLKAMFLTNGILQNFLREKINMWTNMVYVSRLNVITLEDDDLLFFTHFYDMLSLAIERGRDNPFHTDVIQSLLRAAVLGLCGGIQQIIESAPHHSVGPVLNHSSESTSQSPVVSSATTRHFQQFLDLLNTSDMKRRSVESYADELCISPKYLSAICKKHSGKTANEWIREHVLEDIRYNLKQTDLSIKEISQRLGFPSTSFFGKYVKEHFGMTPMQVRKK